MSGKGYSLMMLVFVFIILAGLPFGAGVQNTGFGIGENFSKTYRFRDVPLDLFLEIAPVLDLNPTTEGSVNGAMGASLYFK
jgi:hypothetical protein